MIRAGTIDEISPEGEWLILDIGFSSTGSTCGLKKNRDDPVELQFGEVKEKICHSVRDSRQPVNLVIEAPLSVAFNKQGNPKGRRFEKQRDQTTGKSNTRYWYYNGGCGVMVAALYLIRAISEMPQSVETRLFEGFVSFKSGTAISNHSRDVELLRKIIDHPEENRDKIFTESKDIKMDETDDLKSAFLVAGIDTGIPPVIVSNG